MTSSKPARRLLLGASTATLVLLTTPAWAQTAPTADPAQSQEAAGQPQAGQTTAAGQSDNLNASPAATNQGATADVVVTGSRIARPELQSATPIAVVGNDEIRREGATNVQDVLTRLPQVGIPGLSNTNSNFLTSGNGVSTVNLRNLGDARTLVLVNGRRFVAGLAGTSIVDVNNIPPDFIDRVEVVTGGASSVYGSDAIAGVVNFVLKDRFEGITARAQYGITEAGDNPRYNASLTAGHVFGGGRGSLAGNFTYDKDEGLFSRNRPISAEDCSAAGCGPQSYSSYAPQGRFQLYLNNAGTGNKGFVSNLFTFNPDNSVVIGFPTGYGFNRESLRRISTPVERYLGTVLGHWDLSPGLTAFVEGTYSRVNASSAIEPYALGSDGDLGFGYKITNPFIPAVIQAQIAARNSDADPTNDVDQISFRRRQNDVFSRSNTAFRDTWRVAAGLRGTLGRFRWEGSYVHGELLDHTSTQDLDVSKLANALDAVRDSSGNIVCASAAARAAGCVPVNYFGYNTVSAAAAAYIRSAVPRSERVRNTEDVASASITGPVFALPAGDVQFSVGGEYRKEKSVDDWDALTNAGLNTGNQIPDTVGQFDVKEAFGEVDVPLLKDKPFFNSLSLQGAARYSSYSTIGDVFSWNAGGEWSPVAGVRFRGNYAVANRAPNVSELYSPPAETFPPGLSDPCNGVTATSTGQYAAACRAIPSIAAAIARNGSLTYTLADLQGINGFDGGNPNLQEEKGKTITGGVVLTPSALRGFSLTVDYFNIKIDNAIGTVLRNTSIQQCLASGLPQFCGNVIRNPNTGFITTVNATNVNVASFKTSGLDIDARYGHHLGLSGDDRLDVNVLWTHTFRYLTQSDPLAPINSGVGNLEYGEAFRDKVTGRLSYSAGPFSLSWGATYLSPMVDTVPAEFNAAALPADIAAHNQIASRIYHDVQFRADIGRRFEWFLGVNNLFNTKPPKLEDAVFNATVTGTETAADVYDPFGRRFYAGVQLHF